MIEMSDVAIRVENLSKRYHIGERVPYKTLRETIIDFLPARFSRLVRPNNTNRQIFSRNGHIWALKDVSFEVKKGESIGIIGRNGAGKSTLLKILSRITRPTYGQAEISGRVGSLLEIGTGFHPELTGRENIFIYGSVLGMNKTEIKTKFDEIVEFAEVEKFLDTPIKRYSSGMQMRLAFAVAAHLDPEILLVDEVLAVGDIAFQNKCMGKMESITNEGRTILFVSHNMSVLQNLCPKALLLVDGTLAERGHSSAVVRAYLEHGTQKGGEFLWEWDENKIKTLDVLVPLSLCIKDSNGNITDRISASHPIIIEFSYRITRAVSNLRIGLTLQTANGESICVSYDRDQPTKHAFYTRTPGIYRGKCIIPSNLLNDREYVLGIISGIKGSQKLYRDSHLLTFHVDATSGIGSHWGDHGRRQGILRPDFDWITEVIG